MPDVNVAAVLVATVAAFAAGGVYYTALGSRLAAISEAAPADDSMGPSMLVVEVGRCLILAAIVAGLASQGRTDDLAAGLVLGLALWIGFPLLLWTGAIIHERTPVELAAIHAGDWLVKLLLVAAIVSVWQ